LLQALLRGKLTPQQENMEDLMTSSVFGALQYVSYQRGLRPLLALGGSGNLIHRAFLPIDLKIDNFMFWPTYPAARAGPTEPDVVVSGTDLEGRNHVIFIEVKLWSGKSSDADPAAHNVTDQLAREWLALSEMCASRSAHGSLFYITADRQLPSSDLIEAATELKQKIGHDDDVPPFQCYWISWLNVAEEFVGSDEPVLNDIGLFCRRLGLRHFEGFSTFVSIQLSWHFDIELEFFNQMAALPTIAWRFERA
jgi:hypothetical protein